MDKDSPSYLHSTMNKSFFFRFHKLLTVAQQRKGLFIALLLALNSFLDFASIATFLPLIFLIINPSFVDTNPFVKQIYNSLDVDSYSSFIIAITSLIVLLIILKNALSLWIAKARAKYAFILGQELTIRALNKYINLGFYEFTKADHSRELNRIANQPFAFANNIVIPLTTLFSEILVIILIVTAIAIYNWIILVLLASIMLPTVLLFTLRKKSLKKISRDLNEKHPRLLKYALQIIEGLFEIKLLKKENFFKKRFKKTNDELTSIFIRENVIQSATGRLTEIIAVSLIGLLIVYAVSRQQNYQQTIFLLSVYASASFRIIPSFNRVLNALSQVRMHEYILDEFSEMGSTMPQRQEIARQPGGFNKEIELKKISFAYDDRSLLLKNISLTVGKGEKIAITGKSGQGKTSLLLILLGFVKRSSGEILIDGQPVEALTYSTLTGYVPQNPFITDGSIADNIAFGIPENERDIGKMQELMSSLGLSSLISQLKDGINTRIGEKGINLSGGQRQRIAIARALYSNTEILLLDEITNHLDPALEIEIIEMLNRLSLTGKTIIMITHKIIDSSFFDKLFELKDGRITQIQHLSSIS